MRSGIEDRRVAIGVLERGRELLAGETIDLAQCDLRGIEVYLLERPGPEYTVAFEKFEQVELHVAEIALVMPHGRVPLTLVGLPGQAGRPAAPEGAAGPESQDRAGISDQASASA